MFKFAPQLRDPACAGDFGLGKRLFTSRSPGTRLRAQRTQRTGRGPYFVPRWRDFEGFSLRSKIKVGLDAKWGGFKVWI